jgi:hypothetical protein
VKLMAVLLLLRYLTDCLYFCDRSITACRSDTNSRNDSCVMFTKLSSIFQLFTLDSSS